MGLCFTTVLFVMLSWAKHLVFWYHPLWNNPLRKSRMWLVRTTMLLLPGCRLALHTWVILTPRKRNAASYDFKVYCAIGIVIVYTKYVCMYIYIYIYMYISLFTPRVSGLVAWSRAGTFCGRRLLLPLPLTALKIHQRGVQWKQGVVVYIMSYTVLLYNTTPIHCTPPPTAPPFDEYPAAATHSSQRWRVQ